MIDRGTVSVLTASPWTGVFALIVHAGFVGGTVRVKNTFRPTTFVRVAYIVGEASTRTCTVLFFAHRVSSAGGWHAGVDDFRGWR